MTRRVRTPLSIALAAAGGVALVWLLAYRVGATRELDGDVYSALEAWARPWAYAVGGLVTIPMLAPVYAVSAVLVVGTAYRQRGLVPAAAASFVLVGANVVTQVLKELTATDRPWSATSRGFTVDPVSWPSGHAAGSTALVLALWLAVGAVHRPAVLRWGGAWALAVSVAVVLMGWHLPSDVLAGWLVTTAAGGLTVAALRAGLPARERVARPQSA